MVGAKKSTSKKQAARMRRLREIRSEKRKAEQDAKTREQIAILLSDWSKRGIVRQESPPKNLP